MKRLAVMVLLGTCLVSSFTFAPTAALAEEISTPQARYSYVMGLQVGEEMKGFPGGLEIDAFAKGLKVAMEGVKPLMTPEQVAEAKKEFLTKIKAESAKKQAESAKKQEEMSVKNASAEKAFLAENAKKEGVKTTASGLQYMVLTEGKGPFPTAEEKVTVHYRGTLLDGSEFDSSYTRKEPATFMVKEVIPGWSEALQLMNVGGKYRLFVPSALAYGKDGVGEVIGPNALLTFDVELLKIEK